MLVASLLALPWYASIPAYFFIGALWACSYLPRSIRLQDERYAVWRETILKGRPLAGFLGRETRSDRQGDRWLSMRPEEFLRYRDYYPQPYSFAEHRIIAGFILNIAAWPLRIPQKIVTDYLQAFWRLVRRCLRAFWRAVTRIYQWMFDKVAAIYRAIIQTANREAIADLQKLDAHKAAAKGGK